MTIFAARRVVPPLLIAEADRSAIFKKGEQPRGDTAAAQGFPLGADLGEVRPCAGTVLEQPRLPGHQIQYPFRIDQVVLHIHDKTGVGLRTLIGAVGTDHFSRRGVDVEMALGRSLDAVGVIEPGIEPLG